MICPKCNTKSPSDSVFCQNCGERFIGGNEILSKSTDSTPIDLNIVQQKDVKKKGKKKRYCRVCGGELNSSNKKCEQCGKQYFHVPKLRLSKGGAVYAVMGLLILGLVGLNIFQYINNQSKISKFNDMIKLKDETIISIRDNSANKDTKISKLQSDLNSKTTELSNQKKKIDFFDSRIVFVISGYGNYYYTYDEMMAKVGNSQYTFWAYNTEAAKSQGYIDGN